MTGGVLNGVRVLDFSRVLAGPYAARILADCGAEVIKVQSRRTSSGVQSNDTAYFKFWNRNKRSITLDMGKPESRQLVKRLVRYCDIVIENFTPRVMPNWGLDYENLRAVKPDIIMLSMSGMGQTGPWRNYAAFGPTVQALAGLTCLTAYTDGPPRGAGYSYADHIAGLFGVIALLAALEHRNHTGEGQYIDLSEYEAMCSLLGAELMQEAMLPGTVRPAGNGPGQTDAAPYGCYPCREGDRWCTISVYTDIEWQALCRLMGDPDWTQEVRFATPDGRRLNLEALDELLGQWTITRPAADLMSELQTAGIAAGVVQNAADLARDPQLLARHFFIPVEENGETLIIDRLPLHFLNAPEPKYRPAPALGQDNDYVFAGILGLPPSEIQALTDRGVIY